MKLLALDSSGLVASVAILDGRLLLQSIHLNYKNTFTDTFTDA